MSQHVQRTALLRDLADIATNGNAVYYRRIQLRILAGKTWIDPIYVVCRKLVRDYVSNYADDLRIEFLMPYGDYAFDLLPQRNALSVDVVEYPSSTKEVNTASIRAGKVKRYRAVLLNQHNPAMTDNQNQSSSRQELNISYPVFSVTLALLEEGVHQLRMVTTGGLRRNLSPAKYLQFVLTETRALVNVNNQQIIEGVEFYPRHNTTPRSAIVLRHGIGLFELPRILQESEGGVFSAGINTYIQQRQWWAYPPFDVERWRHDRRILVVISVPSAKYLGGERTYRATGNTITIISPESRGMLDPTLVNQVNSGNGVRFMAAQNVMQGHIQVKDNRAFLNRADSVYEVRTGEMSDSLSNAKWSEQAITSNPMHQYSQLAEREGRHVFVDWQYGDTSLLTPGMAVKYMTTTEEGVYISYGTLHGVDEMEVSPDPGIGEPRYVSQATLHLFLGPTSYL